MKKRRKVIGGFLDDVVVCALCAIGTVTADPAANERTDVCAKGGIFVRGRNHGFAEEGCEGCACLARAGGVWLGVRVGVCASGLGWTDVGGGRDTEGGEGCTCGGAFDKLWGGLVARTGRRGAFGGEWGGGGEGEIRKGECGCACGDMRGNCACPLTDADFACVWERARYGTDDGGGLGVGETLW